MWGQYQNKFVVVVGSRVLTPWIHCLWLFQQGTQCFVDRFTKTIFEQEQDSFC
jgi:hypothetical protein